VERVGKRTADLRQQVELRGDERGLTATRAPGAPSHADDVAEVEVDLLFRDELDPARAVDEIEEGQLPHLAPRHDAPGNAVLVVERLPWLGLLGAGPDRSDLFPVWEPLRQHCAADSKRP